MPVTLSTLDHAYDAPDGRTITKVLAGLDGKRNLVATLAREEATYLQATGSAAGGFTLVYQDGSLERRYRSVETTLPLARVTQAFHQYFRGEPGWREGLRWEEDRERFEVTTWYESWWIYLVGLLAAEAGFQACDAALQTFGGYGYAKEFYVERLWREIRLYKIAPISQQMALNYLSEHVLGLPRSY